MAEQYHSQIPAWPFSDSDSHQSHDSWAWDVAYVPGPGLRTSPRVIHFVLTALGSDCYCQSDFTEEETASRSWDLH